MKNAEFNTPCGFKITMVIGDRGQLMIFRAFEGQIISFADSQYKISDEGRAMISDAIAGFYADA